MAAAFRVLFTGYAGERVASTVSFMQERLLIGRVV